jgi:hypothetical protein
MVHVCPGVDAILFPKSALVAIITTWPFVVESVLSARKNGRRWCDDFAARSHLLSSRLINYHSHDVLLCSHVHHQMHLSSSSHFAGQLLLLLPTRDAYPTNAVAPILVVLLFHTSSSNAAPLQPLREVIICKILELERRQKRYNRQQPLLEEPQWRSYTYDLLLDQ